jgi:tetratricopeptide (TPR) repeat protein
VSLKKWFASQPARAKPEAVDVDDLITLERYEEAEQELQRFLSKSPYDLRSRQKLAGLYKKTGRLDEAAKEYMEIADRYAKEGFHDKALALLAQVSKLTPAADKVWPKIERLRRAKKLEQHRPAIMEALVGRRSGSPESTAASIQFDRLWASLSRTRLVDKLDAEQLKQLFQAFRFESLAANEEIARRGQQLEAMFFLASGKVEVVVAIPGGSSPVLRALEAGDLFGEQALFERKPWVATYRTSEKTMLLKLDRHGLEAALHGNPDPRGLLEVLREQQMDAAVAAAVGQALGE